MKLPEIDFSSLELKEVGTWPLILRVAVIISASILVFVLVYFLLLTGALEGLVAVEKKLENKKKDFKDQYTQAINLDAFKSQMTEMQAAYQDYINELPSASNIPELIDTMTKLGERSGLKFNSIKPGAEEMVDGFYMTLPLTLNVSGSYHNFGLFVSEVGKMSRIVTIGNFTLKTTGGVDKNNSVPGLLSMNLEAKTYWLASVSEIQQKKNSQIVKPAKGQKAAPAKPAANNTPPPPTTGEGTDSAPGTPSTPAGKATRMNPNPSGGGS